MRHAKGLTGRPEPPPGGTRQSRAGAAGGSSAIRDELPSWQSFWVDGTKLGQKAT
jgi:hypothetical protein